MVLQENLNDTQCTGNTSKMRHFVFQLQQIPQLLLTEDAETLNITYQQEGQRRQYSFHRVNQKINGKNSQKDIS